MSASVDDPLEALRPLGETQTVELRVARALRALIASGELQPGTRLTLRGLAERLGVSVTPVRIAVRDLASEGLVEVGPHGRIRVPPISAEEFEEVWAARTGVEPWLARRGAERLTDADLAKLERRFAAVRAAAEVHDRAEYVTAVWAHRSFCYRAAARPRIMAVLDGLYLRSQRYSHLSLTTDERIDEAWAFGQRFHAACHARDGRLAQQIMRDALDWTMDYVLHEFAATVEP